MIVPFKRSPYNVMSENAVDISTASTTTATDNVRFARLPANAISDRRVRSTELRVIAAVAKYADKEGLAYPSMGRLAGDLGVTRAAVQKQIRKAVEHGYIQVTHCKRPSGGFKSNLYRVIFSTPQEGNNQVEDASNHDDSNYPSDTPTKGVSDDWVPF